MNTASRPFCSLAFGLITLLSEAGCSPAFHPNGNGPLRYDDDMDNAGLHFTTQAQVESCMDDNPNPSPSCM